MDEATQELFAIGKCYACEGTSEVQIMRLALLASAAIQLAPGFSIDPQTLFDEGKCYACVGASEADVMELALLARISANIGQGGGTPFAANKFGVGDPNGVVTPDYIGQFYTDTAGSGGFDDFWQAYGLGNTSWVRWI